MRYKLDLGRILMRITKVYTKGGDKGTTSLVGGERVPKNHPRILAYGTVDELNAIMGIIRTYLQKENNERVVEKLDPMLEQIQNDLFNVGADLATPIGHRWEGMIRIDKKGIEQLEGWIDELNESLPPLKEFILPGGGFVGAFFHQGRTVCRRAERDVLGLQVQMIDALQDDEENKEMDSEAFLLPLTYLNRLSDYLFVAGRWGAKELGEKEFMWRR